MGMLQELYEELQEAHPKAYRRPSGLTVVDSVKFPRHPVRGQQWQLVRQQACPHSTTTTSSILHPLCSVGDQCWNRGPEEGQMAPCAGRLSGPHCHCPCFVHMLIIGDSP